MKELLIDFLVIGVAGTVMGTGCLILIRKIYTKCI